MNALLIALTIALLVLLFFGARALIHRRNRASYPVREVRDFLTPEECDHIIALARPLIQDSRVVRKADARSASALRTSSSAFIENSADAVVRAVKQRVAELTDTDLHCQEYLQVTHYNEAEFYVAHRDALGPQAPGFGEAGDRICTVIIYLNDDYRGGHTRFFRTATRVVPERGKAVIFYNLTEDGQAPHPHSVHGADPVVSGEKWLVNQWIRQRPYGGQSNRKARRARSKSRR